MKQSVYDEKISLVSEELNYLSRCIESPKRKDILTKAIYLVDLLLKKYGKASPKQCPLFNTEIKLKKNRFISLKKRI